MKNTLLDKEDFMFDNRYLFSLAMPLMADTALSVAVGVADTMMVAQAGEAAVSGVSCMGSIQNLFIYLLMAFATGGSVVASQLLGMKQEDRARKSVKILFYLTLSFAIITSSLFLVFREEIINAIFGKIEEDVCPYFISQCTLQKRGEQQGHHVGLNNNKRCKYSRKRHLPLRL